MSYFNLLLSVSSGVENLSMDSIWVSCELSIENTQFAQFLYGRFFSPLEYNKVKWMVVIFLFCFHPSHVVNQSHWFLVYPPWISFCIKKQIDI